MRRGRDGHGIDAVGQQRFDRAERRAAERSRHEIALLAIGIHHADELHSW
jgi:hypothetical protein